MSVDSFILGIAGIVIMVILCATGIVNLQEFIQTYENFASDPSIETLNKVFTLPGMDLFASLSFFIQTLYFILLHALYGATIGKKIFRIHVETGTGNKITWIGATIRYISSIMSIMLYGLGYLTVLIDPKRRGLHDFIASTCVVYNTPKTLQITEK